MRLPVLYMHLPAILQDASAKHRKSVNCRSAASAPRLLLSEGPLCGERHATAVSIDAGDGRYILADTYAGGADNGEGHKNSLEQTAAKMFKQLTGLLHLATDDIVDLGIVDGGLKAVFGNGGIDVIGLQFQHHVHGIVSANDALLRQDSVAGIETEAFKTYDRLPESAGGRNVEISLHSRVRWYISSRHAPHRSSTY